MVDTPLNPTKPNHNCSLNPAFEALCHTKQIDRNNLAVFNSVKLFLLQANMVNSVFNECLISGALCHTKWIEENNLAFWNKDHQILCLAVFYLLKEFTFLISTTGDHL